jgi:hypothetical protein
VVRKLSIAFMEQQALPLAAGMRLKAKRLRAHGPKAPLRWWGPVWRGLLVEPSGKHYRAMRSSVWLYLYLIVHADRMSGTLYRLLSTISTDMGVSKRTVAHWLSVLRRHQYVSTETTGRSLRIAIKKWKPVGRQTTKPAKRF